MYEIIFALRSTINFIHKCHVVAITASLPSQFFYQKGRSRTHEYIGEYSRKNRVNRKIGLLIYPTNETIFLYPTTDCFLCLRILIVNLYDEFIRRVTIVNYNI